MTALPRDAVFLPDTGTGEGLDGWWVPTDEPGWLRMAAPCTEDCHHPVHAFGRPERLRHITPATGGQS